MHSVTYQLTSEDLLAAYRVHANAALKRRSFLVRFAIVTLIIASLFAWLFGDELGMDLAALMGTACWLLFLCLLILMGRLRLPHRVRRIFAQQQSFHGDTTVEWSDESITFRTPRGITTYPWADFVRVMEDKHSIVLLQSDVMFNFIPKRALSPEQVSDLAGHARNAR